MVTKEMDIHVIHNRVEKVTIMNTQKVDIIMMMMVMMMMMMMMMMIMMMISVYVS